MLTPGNTNDVLSMFFEVSDNGKTCLAETFGDADVNAITLSYIFCNGRDTDCAQQVLSSIEKIAHRCGFGELSVILYTMKGKVNNMSSIAIYPGSFDPFTNGHMDIVKKSVRLFDKVHIVIGINANKTRSYDSDLMKNAIEKTLKEHNITNCEVVVYEGLIAEYTNQKNVKYMIRGLRNNMDYNYEENIAEINKLINPNLEYVYFRAENVALSSSMVKELNSFGRDVSKFVPEAVRELMMTGCEKNDKG